MHRVGAVAALAALVVLAGCGAIQDPSPTPTDGSIDAAATPSAAAGAGTPSPTPPPRPTDGDGDGLANDREADYQSDPAVADTDGDGLDDGDEVDNGTDPTVADTDDDGLDDAAEVARGTDPTAPDTDGDGLEDDEEVAGRTDPTLADTDGDGLDDAAESEEYDTSPVEADTDGDLLGDGDEVANETDPLDADTDGDGLPDGAEVRATGTLPGADPLFRDVFVEVDYMPGVGPEQDAIDRVVDAFRAAPVDNPNGSAGIRLHVVVSEQVPLADDTSLGERDGPDNDVWDYREAYFDNEGHGYHYALVVTDAVDSGFDVAGVGSIGVFIVEGYADPDVTGHIFMHELGHSLGIGTAVGTEQFRGVDSRELSYEEYPSAMNYNAPADSYGFSDGTNSDVDRDDWSFIARHMGSLTDRFPPSYDLSPPGRNVSDGDDGSDADEGGNGSTPDENGTVAGVDGVPTAAGGSAAGAGPDTTAAVQFHATASRGAHATAGDRTAATAAGGTGPSLHPAPRVVASR